MDCLKGNWGPAITTTVDTQPAAAPQGAPEGEHREESFPDLTGEIDKRTAILVNGTFNHEYDIQVGTHEKILRPPQRTGLVISVFLSFQARNVLQLTRDHAD